MQATDKIRDKAKLLQLAQTSASTNSSTRSYLVYIINTWANTSFFWLSSFILETITSTSQQSKKE